MTRRVLVTGAGGPSAVSFMNAVRPRGVDLFAGDIDPYAAGLYLVPPDRRWILRRGDDPRFVDDLLARAAAARIDVLVPTVDVELLQLAKRRAEFEARGIALLLAPAPVFERCLDKWTLVNACADICPVPRTAVLDASFPSAGWEPPFFVKPRLGAGARNARVIRSLSALADLDRDGSMIAQELLPGTEWSVDVLCARGGRVLAAVPRTRLKIDSGIAVAGRTHHASRLIRQASAVAEFLGVEYVANIQFREDADGTPKLMDVNARFPGTMPLTVAAGIDMPGLALDLVAGVPVPEPLTFREIAIVRTWQDHVVETSELAALEAAATAMPTKD